MDGQMDSQKTPAACDKTTDGQQTPLDCRQILQQFQHIARAQGWSHLHTPKNLMLALTAEVGELAAELQWLSADDLAAPDDARRQRLGHEAADVLMYLLALCDSLGLDLAPQVAAKQRLNLQRCGAAPHNMTPHPPIADAPVAE